jgi:uncharacterized membrane protein
MVYLWLKIIHILSATILFGTGVGSAFYLLRAHLSQELSAIAFASRQVVIADWLFTTPAVIIQPLTGFIMMVMQHYPVSSLWISLSILLYILTGACWIPVVWLQIRIRDITKHAVDNNQPLPRLYYTYMKYWFCLGWPAFLSILIIFYLMVMKPF